MLHKGIVMEKEVVAPSSDVVAYMYVVGLSLWGGAVSYFTNKKKFTWSGLMIHLLSASFAGVMTGFVLSHFGITGPLQNAIVGVAGFHGTQAMVKLAMKLKIVRDIFEDGKEQK
jgi:hypothetical protein